MSTPSPVPATVRSPMVNQLAPLGALTTAPGCARAQVKDTLRTWNLTGYTELAELLVSEMVTNAVEASTGGDGQPVYINGRLPVIVVRVMATDCGVVLQVWDCMPTLPEATAPATLAERGRGMFLVEALSYRWAWKTAPDWPGKCVWAELRESSLQIGE